MAEIPTTSSAHDYELLSAAFEATGTGVCILDRSGNFLRVNRAFGEMLGYTGNELIGRSWTLAAPPEVAAYGDRWLAELFSETSRLPDEWQIRRRDGSLLTVIVSFKSITVAGGERRMVVTFTDIEERKAVEQTALRRSQDMYRLVVENVSEAILVVQGDRLIYGNPRAAELSGYPLDELMQMSMHYLVHPDDMFNVRKLYEMRIANLLPEGRYAQFRIVRRDGAVRWVESSAVRIDWEGQPAVLAFLSDQSERRRQQEALIKSEEHHRQVVDNATEGILVIQGGHIVFANSRVLEMTGYTREMMIGQSFGQDIHPDDREMVIDRYNRRMRGEDVKQNAIFRVINRLTGITIWIEVSSVTIDWEGQPASLSFITDITERKALEDRLKQTLDERETILEHSIVGMVFLNAAGRFNWANRAMYQIFCVDQIEPGGQSLEPFYPSREAYLRTGAAVAEAVRKGETFESELQMRRADGTLFWAYLSGRPVSRNDLSRGTVWVVMDITKRRQLESDLNKSEEHHRQVVNNVTECILVVQDGHIVFANPRVFQLTGFSQEELFARPFVAAIHPDDRPLVIDHHTRRLRGEQVEQYYNFRIVNNRTQAVIWVQLSAVMIEWEGRPATLSFMTDITERKHLEDSLKENIAERIRLETLQIQAELKEAELARHHAEETTRAKSMFLANVSHEIRTPMNAIIGMAHLALRTDLDSRQRDYIEKIRGAGISLLGVINDILDFSKIEAGKLDMEHVSFNLDDVLTNVATVTGASAQEKRLEYLFQVPLDIPRGLVGDPLRLGQVLINLINNAIKFTEQGEVFVACRRLDVKADRIQLQFLVRDTGIGMSPEQTARLFRAFSQADQSTTRKYGGTGLGLSIAKRLVELMGGTIWLDSEVGVGTTIRFTIWFGLADSLERVRTTPSVIEGMRVLLVDDNQHARAVLADSLSVLPVQLDLASSAGEALDLIYAADEAYPYGVVFTDLDMPGMNGLDLINAVKGDDTLLAPPRMVLLSSHGNQETRFHVERARADGFLMKPVNASNLVDTLVELFAPRTRLRHGVAREKLPSFRNLTVLLVEDNEINQQIAVELMRAAGIQVDVAANGRIALDELMSAGPRRYGMVFMDVQMPEMDGHEATRRIRADSRFDALPIVAMTAHAMVEERERCFASGMNDHLAKPINPAELYRAIGRWCPQNLAHDMQEEAAGDDTCEPGLEIEGIDVQDGLARTMGNRDFYMEMLARFRDSQRDVVNEIREALPDDRAMAERLAHSLKGTAGLLGAIPLAQLAERLEFDIHRGVQGDALQPLLTKTEDTLSALLLAIDQVLPERQAQQAAGLDMVDRDEVQAIIHRFAQLLRECDSEATDLLAQSSNLLAAVLDADSYSDLERAAHQYDFDSALAALRAGADSAGYRTDLEPQ